MNDTRADHNLRTVAYAFAGRVMVNEEAEIVAVLCENSAPGNDRELDELGKAIGSQPVQRLKVGKYTSCRAAQRARSRKNKR